MKSFFYTTTILSIISIVIGLIQFDNFRDRLYLLAMLLMFLAIVSGIAYLVRKEQ